MKLELAKEIAIKFEELELAKERLKLFNRTQEFCDIKITGEDGNERPYIFSLGWRTNIEEIKEIRELIKDILIAKINHLEKQIIQL
jgi:hypothetical protein